MARGEARQGNRRLVNDLQAEAGLHQMRADYATSHRVDRLEDKNQVKMNLE